MPQIIRVLLIIAAIVVVIVIGFKLHWLLGTGLIVAMIGYSFYANRSILYVQRGNIAYAKGDEAKALELFEKAHQTRKAHPQAMIGYAYLLLKKGKPEEAERLLQEVAATLPKGQTHLQAKVNLATALWLQGKQDEAYDLLESMMQDYKNTQLYGNLGYFKLLRGADLEEALAFNQEAYEYNSDDITIMDNLAQNYYLLGRLEEANEMYDKVMAKSPKSADSYYYYAMTLKGLGLEQEAREQLELAKDKELALVTSLTKEDIYKML